MLHDVFKEITVLTMAPSEKKEHPSLLQRRKLEAARKERLAKALRENLLKRKEQMRARLKPSSAKD